MNKARLDQVKSSAEENEREYEAKQPKLGQTNGRGEYRAIWRPMPLVDPVTMQVSSFTGGRGSGFERWLARILWKRHS